MRVVLVWFTLFKRAFSMPIFIDSLKTALFVGLLLNLINHGNEFLHVSDIHWSSILLNFIIPFCVSAYSGTRAAYRTCGLPPTRVK
ncbi:MAG: nitrate/nitrite transporter NrtS [Gammaproteobacteria bacterium]|nr:nitrate/nitrite transporter NrtS [Gammaproteobacteria bacterium]